MLKLSIIWFNFSLLHLEFVNFVEEAQLEFNCKGRDWNEENQKFQAKARAKGDDVTNVVTHDIWKNKNPQSTGVFVAEEGAEENRVTRYLKAKFHGARNYSPKMLAIRELSCYTIFSPSNCVLHDILRAA